VPLSRKTLLLSARELSRVRVLVTLGSTPNSASVLRLFHHLGLVCCMGAGYEGVDMRTLVRRRISLTNSPAVTANSVADLVVGLLIASVRGVDPADRALRSAGLGPPGRRGERTHRAPRRNPRSGRDRRSGARRLSMLEVDVGYFSRHKRPELIYAVFPSLRALAEWASALIVCVPETPETRGTVDTRVIRALGADSHLVNVSRAGIVDTGALCRALEQGELSGAVLDVFDPRYLPKLAQLPNTLLTPYIAGRTRQAESGMADRVRANVDAFLEGRSLPTPVFAPVASPETAAASTRRGEKSRRLGPTPT
jgi:lactate dehydrogenase-like 2-hydroxyacid dehydrogenase